MSLRKTFLVTVKEVHDSIRSVTVDYSNGLYIRLYISIFIISFLYFIVDTGRVFEASTCALLHSGITAVAVALLLVRDSVGGWGEVLHKVLRTVVLSPVIKIWRSMTYTKSNTVIIRKYNTSRGLSFVTRPDLEKDRGLSLLHL